MHNLKKLLLSFCLFIALPVWAAPINILPLGDSITDGAGYNPAHSSYRDELYELLNNAAYAFNFVGTRTSNYNDNNGNNISLNHDGMPSIRADQIIDGGLEQASLMTKLNQYDIDIVLLHAGTNDIIQESASSINDNSHATTKVEIENIITILQAKNPQVTILVAKVIPIYQNPDWSLGLNVLLTETWADSVSTNSSKVIIVNQHSGMTANDYSDGDLGQIGVHPNQSGEDKMAQKWFDAMTPLDIFANQLRLDPELTVTAPASRYFGNDITLTTLTTTSNSDAPITFSSTSPTVCSISQDTIHPLTDGNCTILVEQEANNNYLAVSESVIINILAKKDQTISLAAAKQSVVINKTFSLNASSTSGLTEFIYTSLTPTLCKVTVNSVTALAAGMCKLTASQAGSDEYKPATSPIKNIHIEKKKQTVSLVTPSEAKTDKAFSVSAKATSTLAVKINSVTPNICTVTKNSVKPIKKGLCIIKASQAGNTTFKAVSSKKTITLTEPKKAGSLTIIPLLLLSLFGFNSRRKHLKQLTSL
jgi:lysophospholipase L1-like esterase